MKRVRVRFAPSPTGPLHIGGVRTALFNYLFAKKHNGDFLLRIEDTDQTRFVAGAEEYIIESLKWCGLLPNEGVGFGGPHAPYRQSERREIYIKYSSQLIDSGHAYYAFDTPEALDAARKSFEEKGTTFIYNHQTRLEMKNSLSLSPEECANLIANGENYVVRFKMPDNRTVSAKDIIRGEVSFNSNDLDDKILFKSDGLPTYHLANVVDDRLMEITHVIRGEEWLPSMPLHVLLYEAFGWEHPEFAHLPLILKPIGQGKLSKRDGDKLGFPVFPLKWVDDVKQETCSGYREDGYFPEAFVNMLALLGWNPGTEQEIFSIEELCNAFSLERVGKSGSKFDPEKTKWFNQQYLRGKSNEELGKLFLQELTEKGLKCTAEKAEIIASLSKDRVNFVKEIYPQNSYFFEAPTIYDEKTVQKRWKEETPAAMRELISVLEPIENFTNEETERIVKQWIEEKTLNMGAIMNAFRLAIVGESKGPHLFDIIAIIGKEDTISRLIRAIETIK